MFSYWPSISSTISEIKQDFIENHKLFPPTCIWHPNQGWPHSIFSKIVENRKLRFPRQQWVQDNAFSCFAAMSTWQTDILSLVSLPSLLLIPAGLWHFYRQHCVQCKELVFKLLRCRFWGFSPRRGETLHRWGWNLAWRREPKVPSSTPISPPSVKR